MIHPSRDPLANPQPLIERVYAYVAYRIGDGHAAEDVTSDVFERALRYRMSYSSKKGSPISWLIGIARRAIVDHLAAAHDLPLDSYDPAGPGDLEEDTVTRLELRRVVGRLAERDRDLVALRYGADLTAAQIGRVLGLSTNAVEVALHRALAALQRDLGTPVARSRESSPLRRVL